MCFGYSFGTVCSTQIWKDAFFNKLENKWVLCKHKNEATDSQIWKLTSAAQDCY